MQNFICKNCGGKIFDKVNRGYECVNCNKHYYYIKSNKKIMAIHHNRKLLTIAILLLVVLSISIISLFTFYKKTDSKNENNYNIAQLRDIHWNVKIAELTLAQDRIDLARASVKEYGGKNTTKYTKLLNQAQIEHDNFIKNGVTTPPKEDMLIQNPDSYFFITSYYREGRYFTSYSPDFDQYTTTDIERIWGKPDQVITNPNKIKESLSIKRDENNNPLNYETKVLDEQWQDGKITWREFNSFITAINDNAYGNYQKQYVYESQGKPNVYFLNNDHVGYVTPILRYLSFPRMPEKYPKEGLGKYPDEFPENYGMDGCHVRR